MKNTYHTLHRGRLTLRDEEGLILTGYDEGELKRVQGACEEKMDPQVLGEVLHWEIISVPIGALSSYLASWLTENFDVRLKTLSLPPPAKTKKVQ
jgi:hypothetical protein